MASRGCVPRAAVGLGSSREVRGAERRPVATCRVIPTARPVCNPPRWAALPPGWTTPDARPDAALPRALFDACRFAYQAAQVIELRAAHFAPTQYFDAVDLRRVQQERPLQP